MHLSGGELLVFYQNFYSEHALFLIIKGKKEYINF